MARLDRPSRSKNCSSRSISSTGIIPSPAVMTLGGDDFASAEKVTPVLGDGERAFTSVSALSAAGADGNPSTAGAATGGIMNGSYAGVGFVAASGFAAAGVAAAAGIEYISYAPACSASGAASFSGVDCATRGFHAGIDAEYAESLFAWDAAAASECTSAASAVAASSSTSIASRVASSATAAAAASTAEHRRSLSIAACSARSAVATASAAWASSRRAASLRPL